jgi:hypothetical protein
MPVDRAIVEPHANWHSQQRVHWATNKGLITTFEVCQKLNLDALHSADIKRWC